MFFVAGAVMENIYEKSLLYDFYGELLTDHQKSVYEDFIINDLSITEIAESYGISRQAAHDMIKRCNKILADYEEKLRLVDKFLKIKKHVKAMQSDIKELKATNDKKLIDKVEKVSLEILDII